MSVLDQSIAKFMAPQNWNRAPGVAVSVFHHGEVVDTVTCGIANLEHRIAVNDKTQFCLGSLSKQFVGAAAIILMERGLLGADDSVWKYVPELPFQKKCPVLVKHLLHHTSGLRDYLALESLASRDPHMLLSCSQIFDLLARQRDVNFSPGTRHLYSNSGYFLLGRIIERVSGCALSEFMQKEILEPLGMKNTTVQDSEGMIIQNRAHGYEPVNSDFRQFLDMRSVVGASGLFSSLTDLVVWNRSLDGESIEPGIGGLGRRLCRNGTLSDGNRVSYGYGIYVTTYGGLPMLYHPAQWNGSRHAVVRFPTREFFVVALANCSSYRMYHLALAVAERHLDIEVPRRTWSVDERTDVGENEAPGFAGSMIAGDYRGRFTSEELGVEYELETEDKVLRLVKDGKMTQELRACGRDKFASKKGWLLEVIRKSNGALSGFLLGNRYAWRVRFDRRH